MSITNKQLVQTLNAKRVPSWRIYERFCQIFTSQRMSTKKFLLKPLPISKKSKMNTTSSNGYTALANTGAINSAKRKGRQSTLLDGALLDQYEGCIEEEAEELSGPKYEALQDCLSQLTPYARRLVQLRYSEGLTGKSLGDTLGRKVDTVYVALSRVHRALPNMFKKTC